LANILPEAHFTVRSCGVTTRQTDRQSVGEDTRDILGKNAYDVMFL